MKIFSSKKRVAAIGVVTAASLVGGGMAYAYWTSTGTGSGSATTGTASAWSVVVPNTTAGTLTPTTIGGSPSQSVAYTISNAGTGQQLLAKAIISVSNVTQGALPGPACSASDFSVGGAPVGTAFTQTLGAPANTYAVGTGYSGTVALRLVDNGANQDKCQGSTVTLKVDAS